MRISTILFLLPVLVYARNPDKRQSRPESTGDPSDPSPPSMVMIKGGRGGAGPSMVYTGTGKGVVKGPITAGMGPVGMGGGMGGGDYMEKGSLIRKAKMAAMKPQIIPGIQRPRTLKKK
ncbi:hypothetical protein BLS_004857 [Venturia inaequalis]|uniref:Uncharacterized protein n=1 Tax=Venturia inaequalis TaxID=5025 RepID=A0A8H3YRA1_VENIN|nr:hypothetical protein BLS_004857 [Venturia inaequalis]